MNAQWYNITIDYDDDDDGECPLRPNFGLSDLKKQINKFFFNCIPMLKEFGEERPEFTIILTS